MCSCTQRYYPIPLARGVCGYFTGGATLRPDEDSNAELYGKKLTNEQIVMGKIKTPQSGSKLTAELNRYSARKEAKKD